MFQDLSENGLNNNDLNTNYPNKSSLIINAILACLADENSFVQRNTLDFMYSHLKLGFDLFNDLEKQVNKTFLFYFKIYSRFLLKLFYIYYIEKNFL